MQTSCAILQVSLFQHQHADTVIFILFPCTTHSNFRCVFSLCNSHVSIYQSHSKANGVNQTILLCFLKGWPSISSTYKTQRLKMKNNIPWVTYIHSVSKLRLFFEVYFEAGAPNGVHSFDKVSGGGSAILTKNILLSKYFSRFFAQICCYESKFRDILGKFIS